VTFDTKPLTIIIGQPEIVRSILRTASAKLAQANEQTLARWLLSMANDDIGNAIVKVRSYYDKDTTK